MKKSLLSLLIALCVHSVVPAQNYCDLSSCLFWNEQPGVAIDSATVNYATNQWSIDEWDNAAGCIVPIVNVPQCENLPLEIYYPVLPAGEKRPLVVFIHGGAFINGDRSQFRNQARALAKLGYVAATIDYRLCKRNNCQLLSWMTANEPILVPAALCSLNFWVDLGTGAYVAAVDANTAIRYLQDHASSYHIDPENVIVGGFSAGAWTALHVGFLDQDEADSMGGWSATWGPLNPVSGIKGVLCLGGALYDTAFIDPEESGIPVFLLHGNCDATVCYRRDAVFHCNSAYPKIHGGGDVATRLHHLGNPYYLFSGENMGHDITPASGIWNQEMLRFMRETMLCGQYTQKHVIYQPVPASPDCDVLQGPLIQFSHAPYPPVDLPSSQPWGGFPSAPCTPVPTETPDPDAPIALSPTLTQDLPVRITANGPVTLHLFDAQGRLVYSTDLERGEPLEIPAGQLHSGLNVLRVQTLGGGRLFLYKILKM